MSDPIDLSGPPHCVECGTLTIVTEHPGKGKGGSSLWSVRCPDDDSNGYHLEWANLTERLTLRDQPGAQALVAEIERLRSDLALRTGEMERLRSELDRADPHAMTLLEQAVDRLEAERQAVLDASPAAKARDAHPHVKLTDADLVRRAVNRAGKEGPKRLRWAAVGTVLSVGSGVAQELCRACGLDPDEMVGTDGEGEE
jgi:hypothetical protein